MIWDPVYVAIWTMEACNKVLLLLIFSLLLLFLSLSLSSLLLLLLLLIIIIIIIIVIIVIVIIIIIIIIIISIIIIRLPAGIMYTHTVSYNNEAMLENNCKRITDLTLDIAVNTRQYLYIACTTAASTNVIFLYPGQFSECFLQTYWNLSLCVKQMWRPSFRDPFVSTHRNHF